MVGIHGNTDVNVFLVNDVASGFVEAGVENRMLLQRIDDNFDRKASQREFRALLVVNLGVFFAKIGDNSEIGFVELRDARNCVPTFGHALADDLAQWRHRLLQRPGPTSRNQSIQFSSPALQVHGGGGARLSSDSLQALDVSADVGHDDTAAGFAAANFAQVDAEFARDAANRRRSGWR